MNHITDTAIGYLAACKNAASWALHYTLRGTGTVMVATGTLLTTTGGVLKNCGEKFKPAPKQRSRPAPIRRMRSVAKPAA